MTGQVAYRQIDTVDAVLMQSNRNPFSSVLLQVTRSLPRAEPNRVTNDAPASMYAILLGGMSFPGSLQDVAARVESEALTSSSGSFACRIDEDPHPEPVASSRVRCLKEASGLTWDQLRRLFGVSRRALHMWAGGAQMNSRNQERLTDLERVVSALGNTPSERRDAFMSSRHRGGRSVFQQLVLSVNTPRRVDIEALTESTGAGHTIHGDFLFAEVIDGDEEGQVIRGSLLPVAHGRATPKAERI